jgi:hypothetical protein
MPSAPPPRKQMPIPFPVETFTPPELKESYYTERSRFETFVLEVYQEPDNWRAIWVSSTIHERLDAYIRLWPFIYSLSKGSQQTLVSHSRYLLWWTGNLAQLSISDTQTIRREFNVTLSEVMSVRSREQIEARSVVNNLYFDELRAIHDNVIHKKPSLQNLLPYALCTISWATEMRTGAIVKSGMSRGFPETREMHGL